MALGKSRRRPMRFVPPKLQITSMMDMFTIILIFLLFSFSDRPETLSIEKDLYLPVSNAKVDYNDKVRLILSRNNLKLGDEIIAHVKDGKVVGLNPQKLKESELYKRLSSIRKEETDTNMGTNEKKEDTVLFLCDKRLDFSTINSVIKTAGMAGYPNFQFGVLKK